MKLDNLSSIPKTYRESWLSQIFYLSTMDRTPHTRTRTCTHCKIIMNCQVVDSGQPQVCLALEPVPLSSWDLSATCMVLPSHLSTTGTLHNQQPQARYDLARSILPADSLAKVSTSTSQPRTPTLSPRMGTQKLRGHSCFLRKQKLAKFFQTYLLGLLIGQSHGFKEEDPSGPFLRPHPACRM
jgi:hypothetical protein